MHLVFWKIVSENSPISRINIIVLALDKVSVQVPKYWSPKHGLRNSLIVRSLFVFLGLTLASVIVFFSLPYI